MSGSSFPWASDNGLALLDRAARRVERDQRRLEWLENVAAELSRAESLLQHWHSDAFELRAQISRARLELRELQARLHRNFAPIRS